MTTLDEALRALEKRWRDSITAPLAMFLDPREKQRILDCADELAALLTTLQEVAPVADDEAVEVVVCELGDYGPVDREMVTVLFDDMKIAECYRAEDAEYVAAALREYSTGQTSDARDALAYADPKELSEYLGGTGGPFLRIGPQNAIRCVPFYSGEPE